MIRPVSKTRPTFCLNDFQVFKGKCANTMSAFGQPVAAAHEASLLIRDDANKAAAGEQSLYAIHQRSENRIVRIVETPGPIALKQPPAKRTISSLPLLKAA